MTVNVEEECVAEFDFDYKEIVSTVIEETMDTENFPFEAEINILFVSLEEIQKINKEYRDIDKPTDVLSFPLISYQEAGNFKDIEKDSTNFNLDTGEAMLGDIILCVPKVKEQAAAYGHSEKRELSFLVVHSMLHLFGFDHMTKNESDTMETKQNEILHKMGIIR